MLLSLLFVSLTQFSRSWSNLSLIERIITTKIGLDGDNIHLLRKFGNCCMMFIEYNTVDSEIFARILFSQKALKNISDVKNLRLRQDLPLSINRRVLLPFREGFIFTKFHICEVSRK